jgi:UDP-N-acetylglucosamine 2-epimerase (non-hydrolysing)
MLEEINRMVTDSITDYFFAKSETANENFLMSGVNKEAIFYVGNVIIVTLIGNKPIFKKPVFFVALGLQKKSILF